MPKIPKMVWYIGGAALAYYLFRRFMAGGLTAMLPKSVQESIDRLATPTTQQPSPQGGTQVLRDGQVIYDTSATIVAPDASGQCPPGYVYRVGKNGPYCLRTTPG